MHEGVGMDREWWRLWRVGEGVEKAGGEEEESEAVEAYESMGRWWRWGWEEEEEEEEEEWK